MSDPAVVALGDQKLDDVDLDQVDSASGAKEAVDKEDVFHDTETGAGADADGHAPTGTGVGAGTDEREEGQREGTKEQSGVSPVVRVSRERSRVARADVIFCRKPPPCSSLNT